jgi:hypothetical protein
MLFVIEERQQFMSFGVFVPRNIAIICLPNILDLSLPDEGYSRNALCGSKCPIA